MIRTATLILLVAMVQPLFSQEVQWANRVIDFSSQLSDYEYSAEQILGKPNVLPNAGDNPNAWLPERPDRESFIKVGFQIPMKVEQVAIAESYNPGSVKEIYLYDDRDRENLLTNLNPRPLAIKGRLLNIYITETEYYVSAVKIVLEGSAVPGYNGIDAIGISGSKEPIRATQNMAFRRNPNLEGQNLTLNAPRDVFDIKPVYSKELKTLFFTRSFSPDNMGGREDPGDIWASAYNEANNTWNEPQPLSETINNIGFSTVEGYYNLNGTPALLAANITGKVNKSKQNVVLITGDGDQWTNFREQKIKNDNLASFDADYTLADNGQVMIIASVRYDTEGGKDLYISFRDGDDKWTEPKNMGKNVNTAHDEMGPFYAAEENALYFSTAGYSGFGKADIFRIIRQGESWESWTEPENIGTDVNSENDEQFFYYDEKDQYAYFARGDEDSVYRIQRIERPKYLEPTPLVVLRGNVRDSNTEEPLNSEISLQLLPEEITYGITVSDGTTGQYEIMVPSGYRYRVVGEKQGYQPFSSTVALENKNQVYGYELDIALASISDEVTEPVVAMDTEQEPEEQPADETPAVMPESDEPINQLEVVETSAVDEVLFDFNSDIPIQESLSILDRIAGFLNNNEEINIEVAGFTDHIGNELFNADLGRRRAESVKRYLVDKGIAPGRIRVLGFGEKMPIILSEDIKDLRINRRVEFNFTRY